MFSASTYSLTIILLGLAYSLFATLFTFGYISSTILLATKQMLIHIADASFILGFVPFLKFLFSVLTQGNVRLGRCVNFIVNFENVVVPGYVIWDFCHGYVDVLLFKSDDLVCYESF